MKQVAEADLGYIAGIIDGEGWVGISRRKRTWKRSGRTHYLRPVIQIAMKYPQSLERICSILDHRMDMKHECDTYRIRLYPPVLRWLLPQLIPHLTLKRRHGEILLEFVNDCKYQGKQLTEEQLANRDRLHAEIVSLNKVGEYVPFYTTYAPTYYGALQ